ncbi:MAG: hypothetical protein RIB59_03755 [Rhodospirillales bacterium]
MKVFFFLGWALLVLAFGAAAAEMAASATGAARGFLIGFHKVVAALWPNAWASLQNGLGPTLSQTIFALPGWLTFGLPGGLLVWFCRPNKEALSEEDEDSMSLFDELSKQAKRDGYDSESREEYFDDHRDLEGLDRQGATGNQSNDDYTVDLEKAANRDPGPPRQRR